MAAPAGDRKQSMSNTLLLMLIFNFAIIYYFSSQQQPPPPRTRAKPPSFPTEVKQVIDVDSLTTTDAKKEAMKLAAQAREFKDAHDFAAYALLRIGLIVAEKLNEKDAAEVYNTLFPPRRESDRYPINDAAERRHAASKIIGEIVHNHKESPLLPQALLLQAQVLMPGQGPAINGETVGAWETARNTDKQLNKKPVLVRDDGGLRQSTIDDEACRHLDNYYGSGFLYKFLGLLVSATGSNRHFSHALALIFFGISVKSALYPLTKKQMQSFKAMAEMSPHMKQIQDKYKDSKDPEKLKKMNAEMSALYRKSGTNPALGCLLMFVQLPVFFVMYSTVNHYQCQFRQASFLWIPSLAEPDNVLLGLYVCSMIVQGLTMQKPAVADPQQEMTQKMMTWFMPIFFAVTMYMMHFPSAFAIYWLTFNVMGIAQQLKVMHEGQKFDFKELGVKGVVKRLVSPSTTLPKQDHEGDHRERGNRSGGTGGLKDSATNGNASGNPPTDGPAATNGGVPKPRARRRKPKRR